MARRYDDEYGDSQQDSYERDLYEMDRYDDEGSADYDRRLSDEDSADYGRRTSDPDRSYDRDIRYEDDYESDGFTERYDQYDSPKSGGYDSGDDFYEDDWDDRYGDYTYEERSAGVGASRGGRGRSRSGGGHRRTALIIVEVIVLAAVLVVLYLVTQVEKVEKVNLTESIEENIADTVKESAETGTMAGYRNIVFFGVDSTEGELSSNTRSDAIIICSINESTGEVKLVSVYRDTLLNIGSDTYNKCNAAYAKGGAEQAINMLNKNLDLNITDFVTIGFGGLTDVINALGGITITVEEDEISHLNNYQSTMAEELGMSYTEVTEAGTQTLDGLQATAYCRIRYTSGLDYKRAARQRAVLYAIMEKAQEASVSQLTEIVNSVTDEIYTSYDIDEILADVAAIANYTILEEESIDTMQFGFPQEDLRIQANLGSALGDCVIPRSLAENVQWLHEFLFDDEDYEVSETVQEYSDYIDQMTADAEDESE